MKHIPQALYPHFQWRLMWDEGCRTLISRFSPFLKETSAATLPVTVECGLFGSSEFSSYFLHAADGGRLIPSALLFLLCLINNGIECELLSTLDFWVDVFVGHPISPVCSKLPAQTEAVWSFLACFLPLMKSVYHPSQPRAVLIKIFPSARQVTCKNFNLVFHVIMDSPSPKKKKVAFFVVIFSVRKSEKSIPLWFLLWPYSSKIGQLLRCSHHFCWR